MQEALAKYPEGKTRWTVPEGYTGEVRGYTPETIWIDEWKEEPMAKLTPPTDMTYLSHLDEVRQRDVDTIRKKTEGYGPSWKKRGGANAFFMLCRKWDRLENFLPLYDWDIFKAIMVDERDESVLDDIRDLRAYLTLVEAEMIASGYVPSTGADDFVAERNADLTNKPDLVKQSVWPPYPCGTILRYVGPSDRFVGRRGSYGRLMLNPTGSYTVNMGHGIGEQHWNYVPEFWTTEGCENAPIFHDERVVYIGRNKNHQGKVGVTRMDPDKALVVDFDDKYGKTTVMFKETDWRRER